MSRQRSPEVDVVWQTEVGPKINIFTQRLIGKETIQSVQQRRQEGSPLRVAAAAQVGLEAFTLAQACAKSVSNFPDELIAIWYPHASGFMSMVERHRAGTPVLDQIGEVNMWAALVEDSVVVEMNLEMAGLVRLLPPGSNGFDLVDYFVQHPMLPVRESHHKGPARELITLGAERYKRIYNTVSARFPASREE